jgi:cell division protein FtsI/penicillin-binding protein 2
MLARAASRRALWLEAAGYEPAEPGQHVRLTLDSVIQNFAEQALREACEKYAAPSGQLVVLDPRTGGILAMANYPVFDPNTLGRSTPQQRRNRCVTDVFEPGSIFKPFVWAGATELGLARVDEIIACHNGLYVSPKGRRLRDVNAHEELTWEQVLVKSSNIGMAIVGQRMEARRMYDAVRAFGFGQTTGSGLPGEVAGLVHRPSRWTHYSVTSVPMGQEIAVTPLQMVRAAAIVANDGLAVQPTILQEVADAAATHPIYERVISSQTAAAVRAALRKAVMEGTGRRADSDAYTVFGKTGTAQVPDLERGGYLERQYVASFIGGAPNEQPAIVVGCFIHIDDASKGYYGGIVSAPVAREVIDKTLAYMGIAPDRHVGEGPRLAARP